MEITYTGSTTGVNLMGSPSFESVMFFLSFIAFLGCTYIFAGFMRKRCESASNGEFEASLEKPYVNMIKREIKE